MFLFAKVRDWYDKAHSVFSDLAYKMLDWSEAIWEAWILFEHQHGTVEELEGCLDNRKVSHCGL